MIKKLSYKYIWWKKEELSTLYKTDSENLIIGNDYVMVYENLIYKGIFSHYHPIYTKYKYFIVNNNKRMFGPAFIQYDVSKILISHLDKIIKILPDDLLFEIYTFL